MYDIPGHLWEDLPCPGKSMAINLMSAGSKGANLQVNNNFGVNECILLGKGRSED